MGAARPGLLGSVLHSESSNREGTDIRPMATDYYKTLGIGRDASQSEVEKAYRDLARKYHPDLNQDDKTAKQKFQEVQTAFDVLGNTEKRQKYDRYGSSYESMGAGGPGGAGGWPPGGGGGGAGGFGGFDFSEIFGGGMGGGTAGFEDVFRQAGGGGRGPSRPASGANIAHELKIPFATSIKGGEAQITIRRSDGRTETIAVKIPAGIGDNKKIRLRGQGEASPGGSAAPGDLLITVRVNPHPCFSRNGSNLEVRVPLTVVEATRGARVEVPTPTGAVSLSVPAGTNSGTKLRIKGHGVETKGKAAGDLLAEIQIVVPKVLDEETEVLLEKLSTQTADVREKLKW